MPLTMPLTRVPKRGLQGAGLQREAIKPQDQVSGSSLLGQLGVDLSAQGKGLGKALLAHAVEKAVQVSEVVGAVAIEVHAATEQAREFYRRYGFVQMQDSPDHLFLSMEVGRSLIEAAR